MADSESRARQSDIIWTSAGNLRAFWSLAEPCGALWSLVEHLLSIRTAGAAEEKCERWKLGVRLTDIFNKYHAGPLIHKLYTKIHNILTNARMHFTHSYLASESYLISIR